MSSVYTAEATAINGREGEVTSSDGAIDLLLAMPKELGGPGGDGKSNPEQLFAAGYASCFHSAARALAKREGIDVTGSSITARVGIGPDDTGYGLEVHLIGRFPSLSPQQAEDLMHAAHELCPYSKATRGNIPVTLSVG